MFFSKVKEIHQMTLLLYGQVGGLDVLHYQDQMKKLVHLQWMMRESKKNPYSWNIRANILFLKSPTGVGFSINIDTKYEYNDENSGQDNYQALLVWLQGFIQFQKTQIYYCR
ncbi:unnamed protein product [Paramecium primaurelia]|uniref:Uncharacterized protein n=1 Tax=Paramecium primaurelia TaxID=5886 RepID=A0A8S1PEU5_PARPR|nr:unnamed protein product [Paramecium primaurelia]